MGFEIERKYLVCGDGWQKLATSRVLIRQAYLTSEAKVSIRIRITDNSVATLSIKSRPAEIRRLELEYPIPVLEADALMQFRQGSVIEKIRYTVPYCGLVWEVDVFSNENQGLVIAEVELQHENQMIEEIPNWIAQEVTGQAQYYNSSLSQYPFSSWQNVEQHG